MVENQRPNADNKPELETQEPPKKGADFFKEQRLNVLTGALMLVGLILAFFYVQIGGLLVGLAVGLCFFKQLYNYFFSLEDRFTHRGLFMSLMSIGVVLYLLITVPAFVLATAVGFGIMYLVRITLKKS